MIFDVDGTLCDVRSIRFHVDPSEPNYRGKKNFNRFHEDSEWAPTNRWVARLLSDFERRGFRIAIVTGREARWASLTERWLDAHQIRYDSIHYRPDNDERRDVDVKRAHLQTLRKVDTVVLVVDDNPGVIEMWVEQLVPVVAVSAEAKPVKLQVGNSDLGLVALGILRRHGLVA